MNYYKNLFKTQYTGLAFVLGLACIILSSFQWSVFSFQKSIFVYASFILLFAVFDTVGYGNMIHLTARWNDETIVTPYRIMQNMFMVVTFALIYLYAGWCCLVGCVLGWWCGGCDLLFYILLRVGLAKEDYYWMKGWSVWLVITWFKRMFLIDEYIGRTEFVVVCTIGLILGGVISW